ncbi:uncharacterized protein LOC111631190 [Centruroides sculpturatus]|uniref:uncharacterized protein LOC111631190 n=1 Tax=Centruroides sculpturatus TaxID=218467 RepID=UPI000C6E97E7|nr:uncharacterized protein LOC111631190 [Centruroides sculpturatus]
MEAFECAIQELVWPEDEAADPITAMIRSLGGYESEYVAVLRAELQIERERNRALRATVSTNTGGPTRRKRLRTSSVAQSKQCLIRLFFSDRWTTTERSMNCRVRPGPL